MFLQLKRFSSSCFISTPIFYVNSSPHIGHLYTALLADATHRFLKLVNPKVSTIFCTGTDEHGLKIQNAASNNKMETIEFCSKISDQYKLLFKTYDIEYTHYVRTTSVEHLNTVNAIWTKLKESDSIYSNMYKGWYCVSEESFLAEHQIKPDEKNNKQYVSIETNQPVEWVEEKNYMFKLSKYTSDVAYWLSQNENVVKPKKFYNQLKNMCSEIECDISVSRPMSRVHWGVPVPDDETQTVYVWLDALVNYLTVSGYPQANLWPPHIQFLGKDILKFHGIYWPAFLIAAGLEPPKCLLVHSHWTVDGVKMSKSIGNVVDPMEKLSDFTACGLRYFLLREGTNHSDSNYSETKAKNILNAELANTLGNLLNRCLSKSINPDNVNPMVDKELLEIMLDKEPTLAELIHKCQTLHEEVKTHYSDFNFYKGVDSIILVLHLANKFFDTMKPWTMRKENKLVELNLVLGITFDVLRICGIGLQPIVPKLSDKLLTRLGIPVNERFWDDMAFNVHNLFDHTNELDEQKVILYEKIK
uniref:Methionine--tRNA ligase, mitochondrial n=1 Tax=Cacopsylla melanoneura TaxID=428564 RepID=A0A8D8XP87_9HEMI